MFRFGLKTILLPLLVALIVGSVGGNGSLTALAGGPLAGRTAASQTIVVVPEGNDYATQVLRDPWDMSNFSDISEYLNRSDQSQDLRNVAMTDGMFTAQSASGDANFAALFPGYLTAIKVDRDGALHPIQSSIYKCLYFAMDIQSSNSGIMQIMWFADDKLNSGSHWAQTGAIYPQPNVMNLYSYNLTTALPKGFPPPETPWTSWPTWEGLRLDPTQVANVNFQVDWIRLTDCNPVNTTVRWSTDIQNASQIQAVWLQQVGTNHNVLVKRGVVGTSGLTTLDVQGIQAGTYNVSMGTLTSCCIGSVVEQLVVNQAPIAHFLRPSFTSGVDYASQAGNPWDFADTADTHRIVGMSATTHDSMFDMITQSGPDPGADPQFFLDAPQPLSGATYRYLTFRMNTTWVKPWQNVPQAMIVRWIWSILGASGQPTNRCYLVGQDIPSDVGWHVYTVDLHDAFNGSPENTSVTDCPGQTPNWSNSPPILDLRFDPNENNTVARALGGGGPIEQQLDWIRLTAMDQVARGTPYELQLNLNRPASDVSSALYYYTTNLSDPTQSRAQQFSQQTVSAASPFDLFFPLLQRVGLAQAIGDTFPAVDLSYMWDTSNVAPNTYYLCVQVTTGPNTDTYCSDAPIRVF